MGIPTDLALRLQKLPTTQQKIAWALAEGKSKRAAADVADCTPDWVSQLMRLPEHSDFQAIVYELTTVTGLAVAAERLMLAKQAVAQQIDPETGLLRLTNRHDILDWLEYMGKVSGGPEGVTVLSLEFERPQTMDDLMAQYLEDE